MIKIPTELRSNLKATGDAYLSFVEVWGELFHNLTVDAYRPRHLNARLAFVELAEVLRDVKQRGIDVGNVTDAAAEALEFLCGDPVASSLLPNHQRYYSALDKPLTEAKGKEVHPGLELLISEVNTALDLTYREELIKMLIERLRSGDVAGTIRLTNSLGSDLLGSGYDRRHLQRLGDHSLFGNSNCQATIEDMLLALQQPATQSYEVVFRLMKEPDGEQFPAEIGMVRFGSDFNHIDASFLKTNPSFTYALLEVRALDHFAAVRLGWAALAKELALLSFSRPGLSYKVHDSSVVVGEGQVVQVPERLEFLGPLQLARESTTRRLEQFAMIETHGDTPERTRERLWVAIQSLRRGLTSSTAFEMFLNLWVGLESLTVGGARHSVSLIRDRVSTLFALHHTHRLFRDLFENMKRVGLANTIPVVSGTNHDRLVALLRAVVAPDELAALKTSIGSEYPLLIHRLEGLASSFSSSKEIHATTERNRKHISWHVQRLYRIRNSIVHGGWTPEDTTQLSSHLANYLWRCVRDAVEEITGNSTVRDLAQFFDGVSWVYLQQSQEWKSGILDPDLLISPHRLWPNVSS